MFDLLQQNYSNHSILVQRKGRPLRGQPLKTGGQQGDIRNKPRFLILCEEFQETYVFARQIE